MNNLLQLISVLCAPEHFQHVLRCLLIPQFTSYKILYSIVDSKE